MTITTGAATETATLQMLRADVSVRDFHRWMGTRQLQDPDHAMHCLLTECFGDLAPKPFRLITQRGAAKGTLYGYGTADATALREASGLYACPLQARIIPASSLDSKPMPTEWQAEKRLGFEVRIRPVVRRSRNSEARPGKEWDAFQLEAMQHPIGEMKRSREEVYREWLSERLKAQGGVDLDLGETALVSFQRTRAFRKLHTRPSEGPDAVMRGVLTITDADAFAGLLAHGVGRHRAYGYGMLLLRPARSSGGPGVGSP